MVYERGPDNGHIKSISKFGKEEEGWKEGKKKDSIGKSGLDQSNPNFSFITISTDRPHVLPIINSC